MFRSQTASAYLLLSPVIVTVILALVGCLLLLVVASFGTQSYLDFDFGFSLASYDQVIESAGVRKLMLRSAGIAAVVSLLSVLLAYPVAYFVAFDVSHNRLFWLIMLTLPSWISYLLRVLSWKLILGYKGVVNSGLEGLGLISKPLEFLLYNPTSVAIALAHAWAPFAILPIYVSLQRMDRSLIQMAGDLGDGPFRSFLRVTLPLSLPGVFAAFVLIFIPTFGDYVTPQLIGGPSGVMIGVYIAMQFGASNNIPLGSALAIATMVLASLIACLFVLGTKRLVRAMR
ncbi:MAG: ABC transporter permease [Kiloniellales bacterium]